MGMEDALPKLIPNAVSAVAVIFVVWMFLKELRESGRSSIEERQAFISSMRQIRNECHERTEEIQRSYQRQAENLGVAYEKLSDGYHQAIMKTTEAIAKNGEILINIKEELQDRRGMGRRQDDWNNSKGKE